jgi:Tfp pilus assembly protein PilF
MRYLLLVLLLAGLLLGHTTAMLRAARLNLEAVQAANDPQTKPVVSALRTILGRAQDAALTGRPWGYRLYRAGDYAGAAAALSGACAAQTPDTASSLWLGLSLHKLGRDDEALHCFAAGHSAPYLVRLGDGALQQAAQPAAESWYTLAARAEPNSEAAALALAHLYDRQQRPAPARQWYLQALHVMPGHAQTYVELAVLAFKQMQDRAEAERLLRYATEIAPNEVDAFMWLGHIANAYGEADNSITWYRRAVAADPTSAWARWYLGARLCQTQAYAAGIQELAQALARDAKDAMAYYELGRCYLLQGALDQAQAAFAATAQLETREHYLALAYEGLGDVSVAQGQPSGAASHYQRALTLDPANANAARKLGQLLKPGQ